MVNHRKKVKNLFVLDGEKRSFSLCGIDEAGRGPLAGPLVMAGVILLGKIEGLDDSKRLSPKRRERLYGEILERSRHHLVIFDHESIDGEGISHCLKRGLEEIHSVMKREGVGFLFDGNSSFGAENIVTMIQADAKIPEVSAASILAKVTRDRIMCRYAEEFPMYGFQRHKGYGTKAHLEAIERYGLCPIHRRSFRIKTRML